MTRGVLLWLLHVLLAGIFSVAGGMKLFVPAEALQMPVAWPPVFFKVLGLLELLVRSAWYCHLHSASP